MTVDEAKAVLERFMVEQELGVGPRDFEDECLLCEALGVLLERASRRR